MTLKSIYNNISKLTEVFVFVRYKMGLFGCYLIHDFHYDNIWGIARIYLILLHFNVWGEFSCRIFLESGDSLEVFNEDRFE